MSARTEKLAGAMRTAHRALRSLFLEAPPAVVGDVSQHVERGFLELEGLALESLEDARARVQALRHSGKLENPAKERVRQRAIETALAAIDGTRGILERAIEGGRVARTPEAPPPFQVPTALPGTHEAMFEFLGGRSVRLGAHAADCGSLECRGVVALDLREILEWTIDSVSAGDGSRAGSAKVATCCAECGQRFSVFVELLWAI